MKNAMDPMATMPAASPSRPSTKLTALAVPTINSTVKMADWTWSSPKTLPGSGR